MSILRIERVLALPSPVSPSALYIVKPAEGSIAEVYFTNNDGTLTTHLLTKQEVVDLINSVTLMDVFAIDQSQPGISNAVSIASGGNAFYPSSYIIEPTATTIATGQSDVIASGVSRLRVTNLEVNNNLRIAFGTTAEEAETNVGTGMIILANTTELIGVPVNATHYAWLAMTATVNTQIIQGV